MFLVKSSYGNYFDSKIDFLASLFYFVNITNIKFIFKHSVNFFVYHK